MHIILSFVFVVLSFSSYAQKEYWEPSWEDMISKSVAIALVEYTSKGKFEASGKVLKLYKGEIPETEIMVTGFNDVRCGLEHIEPAKKRDRYVMFFKKIENGTYYLWSGYAGDYLVEDSMMRYDLMKSKNSRMSRYYSLEEFERFLNACQGIERDAFQKQALTSLKQVPTYKFDDLVRYIIMLRITGYDQFDPVYERVLERGYNGVELALIQLLGQVKTEASKDLLTQLTTNENEKVATEAKKQLANF